MDEHGELLKNLKAHMSELEELLDRVNCTAVSEDYIYRFYHQSFKVYGIQGFTEDITELLSSLAPEDCAINYTYLKIVQEGTGEEWVPSHNKKWMEKTRPMIEAFFHAKYFLEMAVKYGKKLEEAPNVMPSGWAALLYFYGIR